MTPVRVIYALCMRYIFLHALPWLVQYFTERGVFRPFPPPTGYLTLTIDTYATHHSPCYFLFCFVDLLYVVELNAPPPPSGVKRRCAG